MKELDNSVVSRSGNRVTADKDEDLETLALLPISLRRALHEYITNFSAHACYRMYRAAGEAYTLTLLKQTEERENQRFAQQLKREPVSVLRYDEAARKVYKRPRRRYRQTPYTVEIYHGDG